MSSLTGFILGSLATIWPWKTIIRDKIQKGDEYKEVIIGYKDWVFPDFNNFDFLLIGCILIGSLIVFGFEKFGKFLKLKSVKVE